MAAKRRLCTLTVYASSSEGSYIVANVSIRELRSNLKELVERAEAGEEIVIVRRGKRVARLMPATPTTMEVPDLSAFRASIELTGEPMSQTVIRQRREARY